MTDAGSAPSADRTPISRVRRVTEYARSANTPVNDRIAASPAAVIASVALIRSLDGARPSTSRNAQRLEIRRRHDFPRRSRVAAFVAEERDRFAVEIASDLRQRP